MGARWAGNDATARGREDAMECCDGKELLKMLQTVQSGSDDTFGPTRARSLRKQSNETVWCFIDQSLTVQHLYVHCWPPVHWLHSLVRPNHHWIDWPLCSACAVETRGFDTEGGGTCATCCILFNTHRSVTILKLFG